MIQLQTTEPHNQYVFEHPVYNVVHYGTIHQIEAYPRLYVVQTSWHQSSIHKENRGT